MKTGTSINGLVTTLTEQQKMAADYIAPSQRLSYAMREEIPEGMSAIDAILEQVEVDDDGQPIVTDSRISPHLVVDNVGVFKPGNIFHQQMATILKIPSKYYQRALERQPELLVDEVNIWLHEKLGDKPAVGDRMVRSLGPTARALLSNKYRRLDNLPLLMSCIDTLDRLGVEPEHIVSCEVTERRMYLKVITPKLEGEIGVGDIVQAGLVLSNSEVGQGSVSVQPLIFRLTCLNGAIMQDGALKQKHLGRLQNEGQVFKDDTVKKSDEAFYSQVRDVIDHTLSEEVFNLQLDKIREANGAPVSVEVPKAVERLSGAYDLNEGESDAVLDNFIRGGAFTRWGLANAVTLTSQADGTQYDRATDLERIGGKIVEMSAAQWDAIAN